MMSREIKREEFPNPAFVRTRWKSLDGTWKFAFDGDNIEEITYPMEIQVPFCYQSKMSGIGSDEPHEVVWYNRQFSLAEEELEGEVLLRFGAVDYIARVWVNGEYVGRHEGGNTPFAFEIGKYLQVGDNDVTVKAEDSFSKELPRGKQMWDQKPWSCWYTNTTGIWQSVWLEFTEKNYITSVRITPDLDQNRATFTIRAKEEKNLTVKAELSLGERELGELIITPKEGKAEGTFTFEEFGPAAVGMLWWTAEQPNLIDVKVTLYQDGNEMDVVDTYFGMRKIHKEGDKLFINNSLLTQRLVLDQGYWPESLMTPPSNEAIKKDVELTKAMGFNGARKHQKIDDPRYYYWADKLGLLVWGELPSAFDFTAESRKRLMDEMYEFIQRDYNHPCIISWVPMNESWGIYEVADNEQQRNFARALYYMIKGEDPIRLVSSNDGWDQIEETDFCGIHDYAITPENAQERYKDVYDVLKGSVNFKPIYARGIQYNGVPILLTEMGGVKLKESEGWGYSKDIKDEEEMLKYLENIMREVRRFKNIQGYCYTQLTDIMQETNGLLDADRNPKVPLDKLRKIFLGV